MTRLLLATFLVFSPLGVLARLDDRPVSSPTAVEVAIRTIDARTIKGELVALSEAGELLVRGADGTEEKLKAARVVEVRYTRSLLVRHDHSSKFLRIELNGGDVVYGNVVTSTLDDVEFAGRSLSRLRMPIDAIRRIVVLSNTRDLPARFDADAPMDEDVLFIRTRTGIDHVVGSVAKFARGATFFEWNGNETRFDHAKEKVIAIRLTSTGESRRVEGLHGTVHLRDGGRLTGRLVKTSGAGLELRHSSGFKTTIPEGEIVTIGFAGGDFVHLSDIDPSGIVETPYFEGGLKYGLKRDVGLDGDPVTIAKVPYPKALSMHSRSEVSYDISAGFTSFQAAIGIDGKVADRPMRGAVSFSVIVDGETILDGKVMRGGEEAHIIKNLALAGGKKLILRADFADNFHFNGWAVWGEPILVRKSL